MKYAQKIFIITLYTIFLFKADAKSSRKLGLSWENVVSCPNYENKYIDITKATLYMANETTIGVKGTIEVLKDIDTRPITVKSVVERDYSGNYVMLMNYNIDDLCDNMESQNSWKPYLEALKPPLDKCPIKKNTYDVSAIRPQSPDIELKKDMIGGYRTKIEMYKPGPSKAGLPGAPEMWCCYTLNFKIESV